MCERPRRAPWLRRDRGVERDRADRRQGRAEDRRGEVVEPGDLRLLRFLWLLANDFVSEGGCAFERLGGAGVVSEPTGGLPEQPERAGDHRPLLPRG